MKTKLILIALALLLVLGVAPVAALWMNGNWVPDNALDGYTVVYNAGSGVTSKYKDIDPVKELANSPAMSVGVLQGNIRCGYNTLTYEVGVRNDLEGENGTFTFFPIQPDGTFEIELIPGSFTLYLPDGNGGQPDYSHATIVAGKFSQPEKELIGHCVSQPSALLTVSEPDSKCHTHTIHIPIIKHWKIVGWYHYTWECCKKHCHDFN